MSDPIAVHDHPEKSRYEAPVHGHVAFVDYRLERDADTPRLVLTHTEVPDELRGEGVGSRLARSVLDQVRDRPEDVQVECSFLRGWAERHQGYADLL